jgi:hypothetical protein
MIIKNYFMGEYTSVAKKLFIKNRASFILGSSGISGVKWA